MIKGKKQMLYKFKNYIFPVIALLILIIIWDRLLVINSVPFYIFPRPLLVMMTIISEWNSLYSSLLVTLKVTIIALFLSMITGILIAIIITRFKWMEISLFPYAIILQVTPIIAIAPLIIILVDDNFISSLICAWLVSFFPILSSTIIGLKSTNQGLVDLFKLYKASDTQTLLFLKLPSALPFIMSGFKISAGLSLIGAIVAEFVTGIGGSSSGLAYTIIESSYRLEIPKMFAALILIALTGVVIFFLSSLLSKIFLHRWHESEQNYEN